MTKPRLQAIEDDGRVVDDPTEVELHDLIADMSLSHRFVIFARLDLEPSDEHYMQVYLDDDISYQVEYREGSADKHYQAHIPGPIEMTGPETVSRLMFDWAYDRPGWREALPWERLVF
ncbi:hypothetical protein [Streptomyces palmae]|uniref:Uncharacterized protein n=1 Tax=Streptomyces palmae TaxID=1701085 RepID=A0A4Z0FVK3_9ACTN|nr:hypothetical protein [Streptomyces palmae]TGA86109.1 hypothetical protein E4099_30590 [Streptomyces palmae]